mmetsp:Transcript_47841/g.135133  ORF Transcript_47841/g.135133 Transcript_47841/m.135133 type:complete len:278 (+) Transcript_47841:533-1366(+)
MLHPGLPRAPGEGLGHHPLPGRDVRGRGRLRDRRVGADTRPEHRPVVRGAGHLRHHRLARTESRQPELLADRGGSLQGQRPQVLDHDSQAVPGQAPRDLRDMQRAERGALGRGEGLRRYDHQGHQGSGPEDDHSRWHSDVQPGHPRSSRSACGNAAQRDVRLPFLRRQPRVPPATGQGYRAQGAALRDGVGDERSDRRRGAVFRHSQGVHGPPRELAGARGDPQLLGVELRGQARGLGHAEAPQLLSAALERRLGVREIHTELRARRGQVVPRAMWK